MVLRDVLSLGSTGHEVDRILKAGKVKVDGVIRHEPNFAIGLMDVVELAMGLAYRMVPKNSVSLSPIAVEEAEKGLKLIKITSKTTIRGKKMQYGFHDSKTVVSDQNLKVGDTCVISLPEVKITNHIPFDKGSIALITVRKCWSRRKDRGHSGRRILLPKRAIVSFDNKSVELPVEMVMAVGTDRPVIKVN